MTKIYPSIIPHIRRFLPLLALMLAAIWPIFASDGLPAGADVSIHFWRTFDLSHSWAAGDGLARWSELFYTGYGAPSFAYTGGAFYALATLIGEGFGLGDVTRVKVTWALSVMLLMWGANHFAARRWGWRAGLVTAAALTFSPALYHTEALGRGSFGVILGFGGALAGLALLQDLSRGLTQRIWPAALCLGVMMLSHNLTALQGAAVVGGWLLWVSLFERAESPTLCRAWLTFALGIGLGGVLWFPALLESSLTRLSHMTGDENLDFRNHFIGLPMLLEAGQLFDARLINNPPHHRLGIMQLTLSLPFLFIIPRYRPRWREVTPWLILTLISVLLVMPESRGVWERITPLQQFLFPQRFLNVAAIGLSMLVGFILSGVPRGRLQSLLTVFVLINIIGYGYIIGQARWRTDFPEQATVRDYFEYEQSTGIYGGTSANEFLPKTVLLLPGATGFLMDSLADGQPAQRINPYTLPTGTTTQITDSTPTRFTFTITSQATHTLEILQTYSPLWTATVNGQLVQTRPSEPYGFTLVDIPTGTTTVMLDYPLSAAQLVGLAVTIMCFVGVVIPNRMGQANAVRISDVELPPSWVTVSVILAMVMGFGTLHVRGGFQAHSDVGQARHAQIKTDLRFDNGQHLLGYTLNQLQSDMLWELVLYWETPTEVSTVNSFVHVLSADGQIIAQQDKLEIDLPALDSGLYIADRYLLRFNAPPPSATRLRLGLWACDTELNTYDCTARRDLGIELLRDS